MPMNEEKVSGIDNSSMQTCVFIKNPLLWSGQG